MITGAQAMVQALQQEGVVRVFGYPGAAILPFYEALSQSDIEHVLVRHEQAAGHAASGYARISGKPGVCVVTSGPGAVNLLTALATAYMDSIPLVAITGQVRREDIGRDVFQEADITGAAEPFVKYSYLVKDASDLPRIFREAFYLAGSGRPGPVLLDIPVDVQLDLLHFSYPERAAIRSYRPHNHPHPLQIKRVAQALAEAERPLVCAGGGVLSAGAQQALAALCEKCDLPVVNTMMGIGALPYGDPHAIGMLGRHGCAASNFALAETDLLLLVGARVGDRAMATANVLAHHAKIVHIDIDPAEIGKNVGTQIPLVSDAREALEALARHAEPRRCTAWRESLEALKNETPPHLCTDHLSPTHLLRKLCAYAPEDSIFVADVGQNQIWAASSFCSPRGRFLTSGGMGTMGYALPAAIGAALSLHDAQKNAPVFVTVGDGGLSMSMAELATMKAQNLPLRILLLRNNTLGMIRDMKAPTTREDFVSLAGDPDFSLVAAAYGIPYLRIERDTQIPETISALLAAEGPIFCECIVREDEPTDSSRA